jgi:hypothetical protein
MWVEVVSALRVSHYASLPFLALEEQEISMDLGAAIACALGQRRR